MAPCLEAFLAFIGLLALSISTLAAPTIDTATKPSPTSPSTTIYPPNTSTLNCATKTITTTPSSCPSFTRECPTPDCILLSTIHLNCDCPTVGLVYTNTVVKPCPTICDGGCATAYETIATPCPTSPSATTVQRSTSGNGGSKSGSTSSTTVSSTSSVVGECHT